MYIGVHELLSRISWFAKRFEVNTLAPSLMTARQESCRGSPHKELIMAEVELINHAQKFTTSPRASAVLPSALIAALGRAEQEGLPYSGTVTPIEAWQLHQEGDALIVDVRTAEERPYVGHVPGTPHVAWATGLSMTRNPRFVKELETKAGKSTPLLLLCRSGKRSALAAEAASKAGFDLIFNVLEGFEGEIDEQQQRGSLGGWRHAGLPWVQG
jgi:rhodanese-related sulfurtransferase